MIIFRGWNKEIFSVLSSHLELVRPGGGSAGGLSGPEQHLPVLSEAIPLLHTHHQQGTLSLSH